MTLDDALLAFYRLTERFEGVSPTVLEFTDECGLSSSSAGAYWLTKLADADLIYIPQALQRLTRRTTRGRPFPYEGSRTRKLSAKGLQRAYLLLEAVA